MIDWSSDVCSSDLRHRRIQHAQRRGLAGAVGAEQAGDFTVARLEADIVDRDHGGLALALAGEGLAEVFGCDHGLDRGLGSGDWRLGCRADAARTWLNWTLGAGAFALPSSQLPNSTPRTPTSPPLEPHTPEPLDQVCRAFHVPPLRVRASE